MFPGDDLSKLGSAISHGHYFEATGSIQLTAATAAAAAGSGALAHLYPRLLLLQLLLLLLLPQAQGLSLTCIRIACCDRVHAAQRPPASADTSLCGKAQKI